MNSIYMRSPFIPALVRGRGRWSHVDVHRPGLMGNLNKYDIKAAERRCRRRVTGRAAWSPSNQEEGKKNS